MLCVGDRFTRPSEDSVTWGMLAPASSPPLCWGDVQHGQPFGSGGSSGQGPILWGPAGDGSWDVLSAPSQPRGTASVERGLPGALSLDGASGTFIFARRLEITRKGEARLFLFA